ncbi:hypothetical protein LTR66_001925 [Elasticomyces elasticus]|nr:hypothetical protein LTR66_001925 [Elasticomyces elasticus]
MATYNDPQPRRRGQAYDRYPDDELDAYPEDYRERKPRRQEARKGRAPASAEPDSEAGADDAAPPPSRSHRRSILVDPGESASAKATRRRSRPHSRARVEAPSSGDESNDGRYSSRRGVKEDRARGGSVQSPHDLERKTGPREQRFREKRDGYESEEGQMLKRNRRHDADPSRPRRSQTEDDNIDGRRDRRRPPPIENLDYDLPRRETPRRVRERAAPDDYVPVAVLVAPPPAAGLDEGVDQPRPARRDGHDRVRKRHDNYDSPREDPVPLVVIPTRSRPAPRYSEERGYKSDADSGRPRRKDKDDAYYADRVSRRRDDGYRSDRDLQRQERRPRDEDYYSDRKEDHRTPQRSRSDRRDRDKYGDRDRKSRDKEKDKDWKKQAGALFMRHGMPIIQKEGGRMLQKGLEKYLSQR